MLALTLISAYTSASLNLSNSCSDIFLELHRIQRHWSLLTAKTISVDVINNRLDCCHPVLCGFHPACVVWVSPCMCCVGFTLHVLCGFHPACVVWVSPCMCCVGFTLHVLCGFHPACVVWVSPCMCCVGFTLHVLCRFHPACVVWVCNSLLDNIVSKEFSMQCIHNCLACVLLKVPHFSK